MSADSPAATVFELFLSEMVSHGKRQGAAKLALGRRRSDRRPG